MRALSSTDIRGALNSRIFPNPIMRTVQPEGKCPAAVLVPILIKETGLSLILTKRRANLAHHGGEISFPGGRRDAEDISMRAAALRECEEEIGISSTYIEICGALPDHPAGQTYLISPFVGLVRPGYRLNKQDDEVEEIFEVPMSFFMDEANRALCKKSTPRGVWTSYQFLWGQHDIWGATAGIIVSLTRTLGAYLEAAGDSKNLDQL